MSNIQDIINDIKSLQHIIEIDPPLTFTYVSQVKEPVEWKKYDLEQITDTTIPRELEDLWSLCSEIVLFEQLKYYQWGLVIKSPLDIVQLHRKFQGERDFKSGDMIIGEFHGDLDLVILRCDKTCEDYGSILISFPMDHRENWRYVAKSISEFLMKFIESPLIKYWSIQ